MEESSTQQTQERIPNYPYKMTKDQKIVAQDQMPKKYALVKEQEL